MRLTLIRNNITKNLYYLYKNNNLKKLYIIVTLKFRYIISV